VRALTTAGVLVDPPRSGKHPAVADRAEAHHGVRSPALRPRWLISLASDVLSSFVLWNMRVDLTNLIWRQLGVDFVCRGTWARVTNRIGSDVCSCASFLMQTKKEWVAANGLTHKAALQINSVSSSGALDRHWSYNAGFDNLSSLEKTQPSNAPSGEAWHPERPTTEFTL
jgi:hypothetical protein